MVLRSGGHDRRKYVKNLRGYTKANSCFSIIFGGLTQAVKGFLQLILCGFTEAVKCF